MKPVLAAVGRKVLLKPLDEVKMFRKTWTIIYSGVLTEFEATF